jgi:hypothetical protein
MPEDRRLAAIMFTDIVGYIAKMTKGEDQFVQFLYMKRKFTKQ